MKSRNYKENYQVCFSANDRITKKVSDNIFEVFHIVVVENSNILTVNTIDLNDMTYEDINKHLESCGLKFTEDKKIVQREDENDVIEDNPKLINYTLADRLSISGAGTKLMKYGFDDAKDLNELLLEHDIPYKFDNIALRTL